jgi:hypothetical protein
MSDLIFDGSVGFEGLVNARDIGNKPISSGGRVRTGVLYRSETPQLMTPADVEHAVDQLGIRRVIDLRGPHGGGSGPLGGDDRGILVDFFGLIGLEHVVTTPDGFLPGLLERGGAPVGAVLAELAAADGATLIHCHTGKDRTGFVIATILALFGVAVDDIIADYERSIPAFDPMLANLAAAGLGIGPEAPEYARDAPSPTGIRQLMRRLRSEWADPASYLVAQGIDPGVIDEVRAALTDPAAG